MNTPLTQHSSCGLTDREQGLYHVTQILDEALRVDADWIHHFNRSRTRCVALGLFVFILFAVVITFSAPVTSRRTCCYVTPTVSPCRCLPPMTQNTWRVRDPYRLEETPALTRFMTPSEAHEGRLGQALRRGSGLEDVRHGQRHETPRACDCASISVSYTRRQRTPDKSLRLRQVTRRQRTTAAASWLVVHQQLAFSSLLRFRIFV